MAPPVGSASMICTRLARLAPRFMPCSIALRVSLVRAPPCSMIRIGGTPPLSKKSRLNSSAFREPRTDGTCMIQRGTPYGVCASGSTLKCSISVARSAAGRRSPGLAHWPVSLLRSRLAPNSLK